MSTGPYFMGDVARLTQCATWQVRRAVQHAVAKGLMTEPRRVGVARVFLDQDLPAIEAALRAAGYLTAPQTQTSTV